MKFTGTIIAEDWGWRASNGARGVLGFEFESRWTAMNMDDSDRMAEFQMTKIVQFMLIDQATGISFGFVPFSTAVTEAEVMEAG